MEIGNMRIVIEEDRLSITLVGPDSAEHRMARAYLKGFDCQMAYLTEDGTELAMNARRVGE